MKTQNTFSTVNNSLNTCHSCPSVRYCLCSGLDDTELSNISDLVKRRRIFQPGETVYSAGDEFQSLFIVRSGSVKSYIESVDGEQQVMGFHFAGHLLGVDGIDKSVHVSSVDALQVTSVCEIDYKSYQGLALSAPRLHQQLLRFMSREIARENNMVLSLARMSGERRFAKFLMEISQNMKAHALSDDSFDLTMNRRDIASYLGMAGETVSRLIHRFQDLGMITVEYRSIVINDHLALQNIADNFDHRDYKMQQNKH